MRSLVALLALHLTMALPHSVAHADGNVAVSGTQIIVTSKIRLYGDGAEAASAQWRRVMREMYNSRRFNYKCYSVDFDLYLSDVPGKPTGKPDDVRVLDVTSDPAVAEAFEKFGLYDIHDWELYDQQNGTNLAGDCDFYFDGYLPSCAEASDWFHQNGYADSTTLGYVYSHDPVYLPDAGSSYWGEIPSKRGLVPSGSSDEIIAHEIGHMVGFEHSDDTFDLMYESNLLAGAQIGNSNINTMLDDLKLECRWSMAFPWINFEGLHEKHCPDSCYINRKGNFDVSFEVESNNLDLTGKGVIGYDNYQVTGCGCSVETIDGQFEISGALTLPPNQVPGYTMSLSIDQTVPPQELLSCAAAETFASDYLMVGGFSRFDLHFAAPGLAQPSDPHVLEFPFTTEAQCVLVQWKFLSAPLAVTNVEPFQQHPFSVLD